MTVTSITRRARRFSPTEELFMTHQQRLLAFIASRLPVPDFHTAPDPHLVEDLAQETWLRTLISGSKTPVQIDRGADQDLAGGLPWWLRSAARQVLLAHLVESVERTAGESLDAAQQVAA
ncbi:hypothetical protein [Streptomyces sp. NRRL S-337]|uniref:hypothetical protein n=1 Tax=Streptomyces sp. NRRL S-337 TaxID=1463900 RepID=UPI0004CC4ADC|nr:hypothetical protein [Streptomyces sp. NRRL S-337]